MMVYVPLILLYLYIFKEELLLHIRQNKYYNKTWFYQRKLVNYTENL